MTNKKIKVLIIVDTLKGGGCEEWVKEIARLIDKDKFEMFTTYIIDLRYDNDFSYADIIKQYNCEVKYVGFLRKKLPSKKLKNQLHSKSKVRTILQYLYLPFALVHLPKIYRLVKTKNINVIHTIMHYSFVLGVIISKICNIPIVHQVTESKSQLKEGRPSWIFHAIRILNPFVSKFFTGFPEQELITYGKVPREKIIPILGAIDVDDIVHVKFNENPIVSEFSLIGHFPVLLSVGRLTPEKGHAYSIEIVQEVIKIFPLAKLIILGDGWEYEILRGMIDKRNLSNNVILPGFRVDLNNFYSVTDIYLRTNLIETGTLSSFRAMVFGIPVVGFQNDFPDCIINGENGFLAPKGDYSEMTKLVIELAKNNKLRKYIGEKARAYILNNLDIKVAIREFEKEYIKNAYR
jgi:glycosyltransferase involved in cell wall biosynthesis